MKRCGQLRLSALQRITTNLKVNFDLIFCLLFVTLYYFTQINKEVSKQSERTDAQANTLMGFWI